MARAIKGGEVAPNGEFYKGGQFINTIAENDKRSARAKTPKTGKREIEPFVWAVQPFAGPSQSSGHLPGLAGR